MISFSVQAYENPFQSQSLAKKWDFLPDLHVRNFKGVVNENPYS